jgi:hypothetical protein
MKDVKTLLPEFLAAVTRGQNAARACKTWGGAQGRPLEHVGAAPASCGIR